ncbi:hypothetical protein BDV38DRAFT_297154 [Aspergillus pseudotamarii]|uniref:J domain-containing protein n=1 Tax=Aspergillus pseudotamarii TaxID=132259 RepID=A0A5N6SE07_ASPPS|nr:uncharacterized protein BDV38DRAFT_297154 [Aspergillus pseudotamarii]KAE8132167.1 hypothetical protein BDV38DRAFT_297154 [Aspergillus pseudotamarii]
MGKSAKRKREREKALLEQGRLSELNVDSDGDELMDRESGVQHGDSTESESRFYTLEHRAEATRIQQLEDKDYYGILGLENDCTAKDIRKAYLKLGRLTHPDQNKYGDAQVAFKSRPEDEGLIKVHLLFGFACSYREAAKKGGNNPEDLIRIQKQFDQASRPTLQKQGSETWRIRRPLNESLVIYRAADFADPRLSWKTQVFLPVCSLSNMATSMATWLEHTSLCQRRRKKMCVVHRSGIARPIAPNMIGF